jgi:ribosome-associated translation inhibitor RaiA
MLFKSGPRSGLEQESIPENAVNHSKDRQVAGVQVEVRGEVPPNMAEYARAKITAVEAHTREPILHAKVKLTHRINPASRPDRGPNTPTETAIAQANLNINGRPARAHAAADTMPAAIDLLKDRLDKRLAHIEQNWEELRGGMSAKEPPEWRDSTRIGQHWEPRRGGKRVKPPHEWRHGNEPTHRPDYYPRPPDERQLVRHKSYSLARETPDEAAFEMESMDYDFHLFTDNASGQDSVIYRADPQSYRIAQVDPRPDRFGPDAAAPLTMSATPAPRMTVPEAEKRLEITGLPFVFFANDMTGRGNILYHRYDGHYGLITPAE